MHGRSPKVDVADCSEVYRKVTSQVTYVMMMLQSIMVALLSLHDVDRHLMCCALDAGRPMKIQLVGGVQNTQPVSTSNVRSTRGL